MSLAEREYERIIKDTPPLTREQAVELAAQIPRWTLGEGAIRREVKLSNFREAMALANKVAELAEQARHHPDIAISYNRVTLELSTHSIGGLSANDFILAARIERLL